MRMRPNLEYGLRISSSTDRPEQTSPNFRPEIVDIYVFIYMVIRFGRRMYVFAFLEFDISGISYCIFYSRGG